MRIDLHLHTTASDGTLSPAEMVQLAASLGLEFIAITDHDSVEGVATAQAAAKAYPNLMVIPGVEISTDIPYGEVHILGYFIDYNDPGLKCTLEKLRNSRLGRAQKMVAKLAKLGIHIELERVLELAAGASVGRPHIAQVMLEGGYIASRQEAFANYIGRNGPAYAEREKMTPVEAVELVTKVGGLPVLAHPAENKALETLLPRLKKARLVGLEVYYNDYSPEVIERLAEVASRHGLIPCGGSDYHGPGSGLERRPGSIDIPPDSVKQLIALAELRHTKEVLR